MQLTDILCYVVLMLTVTTSSVQAEEHKKELSVRNNEKRITKRDAAIFIDSFPIEPIYKYNPQVIYRRTSSPRYKNPKPRYGPPRTKYRSAKPSRVPSKKYKKNNPHKYGSPKYKKRPHKPRYGPPMSASHKPVYGPPKKKPHYSYYPPEPVGFGEPPNYLGDYQSPKATYGEPPIDSYGSPLKITSEDLYPPLNSHSETMTNYDNQDYGFGQEYKSWKGYLDDQRQDNNFAHSKKRPTYVKPEPEEVFDTVSSPDEDFDINSYSDVYKYRERLRHQDFDLYERRKKPHYFGEDQGHLSKKLKKQWKIPRVTPDPDEDQVIVGGQYAEPPARYVPKFQPSAPMYTGDDDFTPKGFGDSEVAASATISPYVNYKNGNIAFSPQNLNDAFSIVDK